MNFFLKIILIAVLFLSFIGGLFFFGSRWALQNAGDPDIMALKPWQPFARMGLVFFFISFGIIIIGALIRTVRTDH